MTSTSSVSAAIEISSQRPARVSASLRSSTRTSAPERDPRGRGDVEVGVATLMPGTPSGGLADVALGVGGELEEQVLEAALVAGAQVGEHDRALGRHPADVDRLGGRPGARRRPA